jgi:hypothetical protein
MVTARVGMDSIDPPVAVIEFTTRVSHLSRAGP